MTFEEMTKYGNVQVEFNGYVVYIEILNARLVRVTIAKAEIDQWGFNFRKGNDFLEIAKIIKEVV